MSQGHSFETDAHGNLVGVPTNLKVDGMGNVFDGSGNFVGRAGEVYVDTDGNAVNAAGQIVGFATAGVRAPVTEPMPPSGPSDVELSYGELPDGDTQVLPYADPVQPAGLAPEVDPVLAHHAAEVLQKADFYRDATGGLLSVPTNLTVDEAGFVRDGHGNIVGRNGEVFVDTHGNAINAAGQIVGSATAPLQPIIDSAYQPGVESSNSDFVDEVEPQVGFSGHGAHERQVPGVSNGGEY